MSLKALNNLLINNETTILCFHNNVHYDKMIDTHIIDSLYNTYVIHHIVTADNRKSPTENSKHLIDSILCHTDIPETSMRKICIFHNVFSFFVTWITW